MTNVRSGPKLSFNRSSRSATKCCGTVSKLGAIRKTAVAAATRSSDGYSISQRRRKRIEEIFDWIKEAAGFASVKVRGKPRVNATFTLAVAACNLIRIRKLLTRSAA